MATDSPLPMAMGWLIVSVTNVSFLPRPVKVLSMAAMITIKYGR
jgi:hypothetical protein